MPKIGIRDIAVLLAKKKEMPVEEAEKYIDAFFGLINEALVSDKIVKIKGLGTFKLVEVRDRESVDVNTGERMVIDGHSKISFVPDNTLKELVNKPFSQFETVVLNDGVDFDKDKDLLLDNTQPEEEHKADPEAVQEDIPETAQVDTPENSDKADEDILPASITKALDDARITLDDANAAETVPDEPQEKDGVPETDTHNPETKDESQKPEAIQPETDYGKKKQDSRENESVSHEDQLDNDKVQVDSHKVELGERKVELGEHKVELDERKVERDEANVQHGKHKLLYVLAGTVAIFLIFFGGYYIGKYMGGVAEPPKEIAKNVAVPAVKRAPVTKPAPAAVAKDTLRQLADSAKLAETKKKEHEEANENAEPSKEMKVANPSELANARRMVQTGAYTIDGFDRSVKVKAGQSLSSISKFYLGEGMECYVMVYNNMTELKEGETVNIPKLKLKKKATNKKVS